MTKEDISVEMKKTNGISILVQWKWEYISQR